MLTPCLNEIGVLEVRVTSAEAPNEEGGEVRRTVLEKIEEYLLTLQCGTAYVQGILLPLLTVGKVRVDFRDYSERLQLEDKARRMERAEAILQLEHAFEQVLRQDPAAQNPDLTQKIIIQPPKGGGYLGR